MLIGVDVAHSGFTQDREGENLKASAEYRPPGSFLILKPQPKRFIHIMILRSLLGYECIVGNPQPPQNPLRSELPVIRPE